MRGGALVQRVRREVWVKAGDGVSFCLTVLCTVYAYDTCIVVVVVVMIAWL